MSKNIALIPARAGSKGLQDKNIKLLEGVPLIDYTINAALASDFFDEIILSSDGDNILERADATGVIGLRRPSEYSTDDSSSDSVIEYVIKTRGYDDLDTNTLLQPTSPLRTSTHIQEARSRFLKKKPKMLCSVKEIDKELLKSFTLLSDGFMLPISSPDYAYTARQKLPCVVKPNGAIYMFLVSTFMENSQLPREGTLSYMMDDFSSLDINDQVDIDKAEMILKRRR